MVNAIISPKYRTRPEVTKSASPEKRVIILSIFRKKNKNILLKQKKETKDISYKNAVKEMLKQFNFTNIRQSQWKQLLTTNLWVWEIILYGNK